MTTRIYRPALLLAAGLALIVGCGPNTAPASAPATEPKAHDHPTVGPSGGTIVEWGEEEYHLEFLADHATGEVTVYVLDETAKKVKAVTTKTLTLSVTATPPVTVTLDAKPQEGDATGSSSRFVGKSDALKKDGLFTGSISGEVDGKKYTEEFKEKARKK
jgi:hypothetical protein